MNESVVDDVGYLEAGCLQLIFQFPEVVLGLHAEGNVVKEQQFLRIPVRPQVVDGVTLEKLGEVLAGAKAGDMVNFGGLFGATPVIEVRNTEFRGSFLLLSEKPPPGDVRREGQ